MELIDIKYTLNGKVYESKVEPGLRLIDFLRNKHNLTGTKEGCGIGECGACTIIFNELAVNSCLILACQIDGANILTIEGLHNSGKLTELQNNFLKFGAVQCGFCTPGMILSAYSLLKVNPEPSEEEIEEAIAGNLCRCTGYKQIITAIKNSSKSIKEVFENDYNK